MEIITKKRTDLMIFFTMIVFFCFVGMLAINIFFITTDNIYHGVKVGDISVGGLSTEQAEKKIMAIFAERSKYPAIIVKYLENNWLISYQDIQLQLNLDAATLARQAYDVGRTGNIVKQYKDRYLAMNQDYQMPLQYNYDQNRLAAKLNEIARSIEREARNASITVDGVNIKISHEIIGRKIDIAESIAEISRLLSYQTPVTVSLVVKEIAPDVTVKDLEHISGILSSYTTQFDPADSNRTQNIMLAVKSIDKTLLRKGEIFSFNQYVGPRLAQYGYKEAPVFIDGKLIPDWGGGVCQVSSTLYNAVLLADLKIEERAAHFRPPAYVPIGQDATVADNLIDFKFKNNQIYDIYILCSIKDNHLTVQLLGKPDPTIKIEIIQRNKIIIEPNTIVKQDPHLPLGKQVTDVEGENGFQIETFRIKTINNKTVSEEFLFVDEFKPVDKIVRVGIKTPHNNKSK